MDGRSPRRIAREFQARLDAGAVLAAVGEARHDPRRLLAGRRAPRYRLELFGAVYYLSHYAHDDDLNFFVAYVVLGRGARIHPRIFYKDSSLVWRVATHVVRTVDENWIGKGDVKWEKRADGEYLVSLEETTNLPLEIQAALDDASRAGSKPPRDDDAVPLVLRAGTSNRIRPFADFSTPRLRAAERYRLNSGRPVVRLARTGDPSSLRFAAGFEPDFGRGVLEVSESASRLYGGKVEKYRILSQNRLVQYPFVVSPTHAWMNPPQALTTELMTYGTRTVHVRAVDEAFIPGFEFHYYDDNEDPPELHSQIPDGYAGAPSAIDPSRADASAWNEALPVIQEFRRRVVRGGRGRRRK
ncbi:MAG: hypothetical protein GY711_02395 [bacterium]|nr:hypothetical protein [bacterium]